MLIVDKIPDFHFNGDTQCFPLYWYTERKGQQKLDLDGEKKSSAEKIFERHNGVTDWILRRAWELYGVDVTREDIFFYVYGFLHLPGYRKTFANELKKSLPRIFLVADAKKFWALSKAGRALAEIHLNYETQPPAEVQLEIRNEELGIDVFRVKKLKLVDDRRTLIYNEHITIKNIPPRSFDYVVNGRSPLEWIIDRYQIKTDTASGIVNDANAWGTEHGKARYILDLILSAITVSLKTLAIIDDLPAVDFDA